MSRSRALEIKALVRDVVDRQLSAFGIVAHASNPVKIPSGDIGRLLDHIVGNVAMVIDMAIDEGDIKGDDKTTDGYHTFKELYEHRIALFIALCAEVFERAPQNPDLPASSLVWRSKLHSDGTMFEGWFIAGIGTEPGEQITYHLPLERWSDLDYIGSTLERAPTFDGHTPADVLARIRRLRGSDR